MNEIRDRATSILTEKFGIASDIDTAVSLGEFELDSLILLEYGLTLGKEFGVDITQDEVNTRSSINDVVGLLQRKGVSP